MASSTVAAFADRLGKLRSTVAGLATLVAGLVVMVSAGRRLAWASAALLVFLLGFEYAFVTSLSLVSEAMPDARGATLAICNARGDAGPRRRDDPEWLCSTARSGSAARAALSASAAAASLTCYLVSRRRLGFREEADDRRADGVGVGVRSGVAGAVRSRTTRTSREHRRKGSHRRAVVRTARSPDIARTGTAIRAPSHGAA